MVVIQETRLTMGDIKRLRGLGGSEGYPIGMDDIPDLNLSEFDADGTMVIGDTDDNDDMVFEVEEHPLYLKLVEWDPRWGEWGYMFEEEQWEEEILPAVQCNFFGILMSEDEIDMTVCGWDNLQEAKQGIVNSLKEGYKVCAFYDMIKRRILPVEIKIEVIIHLKPIEVDVSEREDNEKGGIVRL